MSFEFLILELGMNTNFAILDYNKYKCLATSCLVKSTWKFLYDHNITLQHDIKVPKNTVYDLPLMPEICRQNPSILELEEINQCRLYLQAYYISDLTSASGKKLLPEAMNGRQLTLGRATQSHWPKQGLPGKKAWNTWRKFLKASILARGMNLKMDLGPWLQNDLYSCHWYFSPTSDSLIQITNDKQILLHPRYNRRTYNTF
jgi:hypothetical protein